MFGKVPGFLHSLPKLQHLSLSCNKFEGPIPLGPSDSCDTLESLHLAGNILTGDIPSALGNCSQLRSLVLRENDFSGSLPPDLGHLSMLQLLDVSKNNLSGEIPAELGNCSALSILILTNTQRCLSGLGCSFIDIIFYDSNLDKPERNKFEGSLPSSITILSEISIIWAPKAGLAGVLPDDWSMCQMLTILNLAENGITGKFPSGLASCRSLVMLDLSVNQLQGSIPSELPIPCMVLFNVSRNTLSGVFSSRATANCSKYWISPSTVLIGQPASPLVRPFELLSSAQPRFDFYGRWQANSSLNVSAQEYIIHDFSENSLSGPLPGPLIGNSLTQVRPRYALFLAGNEFTGDISSSLFSICGNFWSFAISLSRNQLSGELPAKSIESCSSLVHLDAANNYLTGNLPQDVADIRNLSHVDLGSNNLNGSIPHQWGHLLELQYLSLQNNSLSGNIPTELGKLFLLQTLDLSKNHLTGEIPKELGQLKQLKSLILNNNYFSGRIPETFCNLSALNFVDMAFNNLSGPIPQLGTVGSLCSTSSFRGNPLLGECHVTTPVTASDSPTPLADEYSTSGYAASKKPKLNSVLIAGITAGSAILVVLFILALLFQYTRQQTPRRTDYRSCRKEVVTFTTLNFHLTYENVVRATGNFSVDNLIGNGGFGATYKAELMPGLVVAVKRLAIGRFQGVQQFDTEIRTLGRIRHPNLVTLVGYHASEAEMFLIYNFFPRGNLEGFIHNRQRGEISWQVVHKIALRIAQALAFLHDDCFPRVLHRDIKPSNILLDNNLNAYLSDFGLARLLGASETHATTDVAGTFGYVAPEYAMTCRVSDKADVYSYGVVLLELLSGKRALDPCFSDFGDGFNIVGWVCLLIGQGRTHEIFIVELWELGPESHLLEALKLAVMCTVDSLVIRPSMRQVVERLRSIQPSMPFS
ncbi:hypothetical protein O6H91_06G105300 [Diphasiastrum complanatum]|nr:hypothetical protein O6H91_06G105300 [Diphasiastrum complanatum]